MEAEKNYTCSHLAIGMQDKNNVKTAIKSFENVATFRYLRRTVTQNYIHKEIKNVFEILGNACYVSILNLFVFRSPT